MSAPETAVAQPDFIAHPPPLSLYVHLPWCVSKCPYCDFNSHRAASQLPDMQYAKALLADAETLLPLLWGRRPKTVFFGGGTPSMFSPAALDAILCGLRALSLLPPDIEVTLEANPDSSDAAKFAEFAALGINRLSLGVQSFNDDSLSALGRAHDSQTATAACAAAARTFDNFNIDLMHALPAQNATEAVADVERALSFAPPHLSLYQLTLEPGTPFHRTPPTGLPPPDDTAVIGDAVCDAAQSAGFERYEISAYAKNNRRCAHNMNYWQFGDYAGIGAGAHGKITVSGTIRRDTRIKHPGDYMQRALDGNAISETRNVRGREAVFEFMLNVLRLPEGFTPALLLERTGVSMSVVEEALHSCEQDNLIYRDAHLLRPTAKGLRFLNEMLERFLP